MYYKCYDGNIWRCPGCRKILWRSEQRKNPTTLQRCPNTPIAAYDGQDGEKERWVRKGHQCSHLLKLRLEHNEKLHYCLVAGAKKMSRIPKMKNFTQLKISASLLTACMFARELSVFISPTSAWAVWQRIVTVFFVKHNAETYCLIQGDLTAAVSMIIALYH